MKRFARSSRRPPGRSGDASTCGRAVLRAHQLRSIGGCGTHATEHLDRLRAERVRKDVCELAEWHLQYLQCGGPIQANHGIVRQEKAGNLRWLLPNGFSGCRDVNMWTKDHPAHWHDYLRTAWGADHYEHLRRVAISGAKPDYDAALAALSCARGRRSGDPGGNAERSAMAREDDREDA